MHCTLSLLLQERHLIILTNSVTGEPPPQWCFCYIAAERQQQQQLRLPLLLIKVR